MTVFKGCLHPWTAAGAGPCAARLLSATRQAARYDCSDAQFGAKIWCSVKQLACKSSMPTRVYQGEKNKRIRTECRNEEGAKAEADDNVIVAASAAEMLLPHSQGRQKSEPQEPDICRHGQGLRATKCQDHIYRAGWESGRRHRGETTCTGLIPHILNLCWANARSR